MNKPLLTPAEKAFLKAVIKPYRKWVEGILKMNSSTYWSSPYSIVIGLRYLPNIVLPINDLSNSYQFKGLETDIIYDLKTLGL